MRVFVCVWGGGGGGGEGGTGNPSQATFQSSWTALLLEVFNLRLPSKNFSQWFKWGTLHPIKQP